MDKKGTQLYTGYSGVTYNDVADFTGKTIDSSEYGLVEELITGAEMYLAKQCNRNFLSDLGSANNVDYAYYETIDAGLDEFRPFNFPLEKVTKIVLDGTTVYVEGGLTNIYEVDVDFFVYEDHVEFYTPISSATNNRRAMAIYYTIEQFWGDDVKTAIKRMASEIFLQKEYGGKDVNEVNAQGFDVKFDPPKYMMDVVEGYRKILL